MTHGDRVAPARVSTEAEQASHCAAEPMHPSRSAVAGRSSVGKPPQQRARAAPARAAIGVASPRGRRAGPPRRVALGVEIVAQVGLDERELRRREQRAPQRAGASHDERERRPVHCPVGRRCRPRAARRSPAACTGPNAISSASRAVAMASASCGVGAGREGADCARATSLALMSRAVPVGEPRRPARHAMRPRA